MKLVAPGETAILDSTAHALKFAEFQNRYFQDDFGPEFEIIPKDELKNYPQYIRPGELKRVPEPGTTLTPEEFSDFVKTTAGEIAKAMGLSPK